MCEEFSAREAIQAVFEQEPVTEPLPPEVATCLYRVAQEALHNVQKHAQGASHVRLRLSGDSESVRLCIQDDGAGFDSETGTAAHGLGIISMKERVRLVQGDFSICSQPGQGTTLTVLVPLPREAT
jgi:signal transduction histidine kinase